MNTLSTLGFCLLINQPTRIFHNEGSNTVTCSTIDHLIAISSSDFTKSGVSIADVSHHLPIFGLMSSKSIVKIPIRILTEDFFTKVEKINVLNTLKKIFKTMTSIV